MLTNFCSSVVEELGRHVENYFVVFSAIVYFAVLGRRGIAWERCWTALLLASLAMYEMADLVFVRLYVPNRYTRYSMFVLLVLWHATNLDRVLARVSRPALRHALLVVVLVAAGFSYHGAAGRFVTRNGLDVANVASFVRTLPNDVLLGGPPRYLDDILIQSKRSVLSTYKLNHGWNVRIHDTLRERTLAIYRAIYARDEHAINVLHEDYGVTHLVVERSYFGHKLEKKRRFRSRYNQEIWDMVKRRSRFLLREPPQEAVVYDDGSFVVLELPLPDTRPR